MHLKTKQTKKYCKIKQKQKQKNNATRVKSIVIFCLLNNKSKQFFDFVL